MTVPEGHEPHEKHLQLGTVLTEADDDSERTEITDEEKEALWADATTVEQFAADLDALAGEDPLVQWELARLRQEGA